MDRRAILRRASMLALPLLVGCSGTQSTDTATSTPNGTTAPTTTVPESTTDEETPHLVVEQEYDLGESHQFGDWTVAVTSVTLDTTFRTDDDAPYRMPDGEQFAVVTVEVTNGTCSRKTWTDTPFVLVADDRLFVEQPGFEHPDFDEPVQMDDLTRVDHMRRYAPSGHPVEGDETVRSWLLFVFPRGLTREGIEVGFDGDLDDGRGYPIRWVPKKG